MEKVNKKKAIDFLINNGVIIVMFILVIYTGLTTDNFFTSNNLLNTLMNMSSRLVIALGIAGCVITAGCDLSAGRMIGFGGCIAGVLLQRIDYSNKFFAKSKSKPTATPPYAPHKKQEIRRPHGRLHC